MISLTGFHIKIRGIVQGVGFRPFIHRQVKAYEIKGWIRNTSFGAELKVEGETDNVSAFIRDLRIRKPPLAVIEKIHADEYEPCGFSDFEIIPSFAGEEADTLISPDICTCDDCLKELSDPSDRRYRYPFINCTNCGPRFTIIKNVPYDRKSTTMAPFVMCPACENEYTDIEDRRYHAQPDCCPACGPRLYYRNADGSCIYDEPAGAALEALRKGKIIAVKGLGGFHLACRADTPAFSHILRERKKRDRRPFALMCADTVAVRKICLLSEEEEQLLSSPARPIVLLRKREKASFSHISENDRIGIMLPYTPVHFLLFSEEIKTLVMTSANLSDRPVIYKNEEALTELSGICDGFLMHDREIEVRCDDSVMWPEGGGYFMRRSRGYAPYPVTLESPVPMMLACGAEQKATFSLSKKEHVFPSQHIGDLKNIESYENFRQQIVHFEKLFSIKPEVIACDLHPDYLSSVYAEERSAAEGIPLVRVQHHHAHMVSCMTDNDLTDPVIGIIWDGTGLGEDGTVWGGEFLAGDAAGYERHGSIRPVKLPGGDKAIKEIWRVGLSLLEDAFAQDGDEGICEAVRNRITEDAAVPETGAGTVRKMLAADVNCPPSSGMGRLFDGVSAILGICRSADYEGEGAILLEAAAGEGCMTEYEAGFYEDENGVRRFDWRPMIRGLASDILADIPVSLCAAKFMNTLTAVAADQCIYIRRKTGLDAVVLSGGTFQNMYLLKAVTEALRAEGLTVYHHHRVSTNDEGISLGQLMIAGRRMREKR